MSVIAIGLAWKLELKPTEKLVFLALADSANEEHGFTCWPSLSFLEKKTGLCRTSIWTTINKLIEMGLVSRVGTHSNGTTIYKILIVEPTPMVGQELTHPQVRKQPRSGNELGQEVIRGRSGGERGVGQEVNLKRNMNRKEPEKEDIGHLTQKPKDQFEAFWNTYPRKVKKKTARDIWKRKKLNAKAEKLIADVETRLKQDQRWLDGYIPDPTTYLNQERWDDELTKPSASVSPRQVPRNEVELMTFARRMGIEARPGETMEQFRGRVIANLDVTA